MFPERMGKWSNRFHLAILSWFVDDFQRKIAIWRVPRTVHLEWISFKSIILFRAMKKKGEQNEEKEKRISFLQSAFCLSKQETINTQIWEINTRQTSMSVFYANHARYLAIGKDYNANEINEWEISNEKQTIGRRELFVSINVVLVLIQLRSYVRHDLES